MTEVDKAPRSSLPIVLLSFVAHPNMPSEPGVGWQFLLATAQVAARYDTELHVYTNGRSVAACKHLVDEVGLSRTVRMIGVDPPLVARWLRWDHPRFTRLEHVLWSRLVGRRIAAHEASQGYLYAHHVTFATEMLPSPLSYLSASTFRVWGPVGSAGIASVFLMKPRSGRSILQAAIQVLRDRISARVGGRTSGRVDLLLATDPRTAKILGPKTPRIQVFPNFVLDAQLPQLPPNVEGAVSTREILAVGHLIPRKRFELAIRALQTAPLKNYRLRIIGGREGAWEEHLRRYSEYLGVDDRVIFEGKADRSRVLEAMARARVLFHPSGREGASAVVGEATMIGLPVVCFAGTGAAAVLAEAGTSGIVVVPRWNLPVVLIADALVQASELPRVTTDRWSFSRLVRLSDFLASEALARSRAIA